VDIFKALGMTTVDGSLQAGDILRQPEVDRIIAQLVDYKNPLRQNIPRKRGEGKSWIINRRQEGETGPQWVADTDTINEDQGKYTQATFDFKTLASKGKVTRKLQAVGRSYANILADEIEARTVEFRNIEDQGIITGNATSSPNQFDGLKVLIPVTQGVFAGGSGVATGGALTLSLMDQLVDKAIFDPDMLIMSRKMRRSLNALLQSNQRFIDKIEVKGGFKVMSYNDIPIFTSTNAVDTQQFDGFTVTSETGGILSSIYCLDSEHTWMGVLTEVTVMPLAKTTSQFDEFDIFVDEALVLRNTLAVSKLLGLTG
jgi:hypothetical protein